MLKSVGSQVTLSCGTGLGEPRRDRGWAGGGGVPGCTPGCNPQGKQSHTWHTRVAGTTGILTWVVRIIVDRCITRLFEAAFLLLIECSSNQHSTRLILSMSMRQALAEHWDRVAKGDPVSLSLPAISLPFPTTLALPLPRCVVIGLVSPISPLYLPCISPISPLYLPYISPGAS